MTHPNVEYFQARAKISKTNSDEALRQIANALNLNGTDPTVEAALSIANYRLRADQSFIEKLLAKLEDYEEQIALLK